MQFCKENIGNIGLCVAVQGRSLTHLERLCECALSVLELRSAEAQARVLILLQVLQLRRGGSRHDSSCGMVSHCCA